MDWTKPPYRVGSIVTLVLEGEDPGKIDSAEYQQRTLDYYAQLRRGRR